MLTFQNASPTISWLSLDHTVLNEITILSNLLPFQAVEEFYTRTSHFRGDAEMS